MFPLPQHKIVIRSPHPPQIVYEQLCAATRQDRPWFPPKPTKDVWFIGKVKPNEFNVMPLIEGRDSYNPRILGQLVELPSGQGTEVNVTMGIHPGVMVMLFGFFSFITYPFIQKPTASGLIPLFFLCAFHAGMTFFCFWPNTKKAEGLIRLVSG